MNVMTAVPELNDADWLMMEREYCRRSLGYFAKRAWRVLEPEAELKWGWALDAICEHLGAVHSGEISRLLINVPPGCMKSLLTGVMFPAWEWGPRNRPDLRFIGTSHKEPLAVRDNVKCRRLIESDWYQRLWPVKMASDQNNKLKFENASLGFREAMAFSSMTGSRGDRVLLDDPTSVDDAKSDTILKDKRITFVEALPSRVNNPEKSAIIVIMQRLHTKDIAGVIISEDREYEHLILPMRFEEERRCHTVLGVVDPRKNEGELLFPERFPEKYVSREEKEMGAYATAGQFQQRPAPRGGGLFVTGRIKEVDRIPSGVELVQCRGWDLAATSGAGAYTAGVKIGYDPDEKIFYILDVYRDRIGSAKVRKKMLLFAESDGEEVAIVYPKDPGQAGKDQAQDIAKNLVGFNARSEAQTGSKVTRAEPFSAQIEAGNVRILNGTWTRDFIDELGLFPNSTYKDQVDAAASSFNYLQRKIRVRQPELSMDGGKQVNMAQVN